MNRSALLRRMVFGCTLVAAAMSVVPVGATVKLLYAFKGEEKGSSPESVLVQDAQGNFYGTTSGIPEYFGTVFKLAPDGAGTVIHTFGSDGQNPVAGLILDSAGNLYGTTSRGGSTFCGNAGCGTVFKIAPDGTETVLYTFVGAGDGANPAASLIMDKKGNLFGTTEYAGRLDCGVAGGCGSVFKITAKGRFVLLHGFNGKSGSNPRAPLIFANNGELVGTAQGGGNLQEGVVFEIASDGTYSILHSFGPSPQDGVGPAAGLLMDQNGNLYGTTEEGGQYSYGTVFKLAPDGTESILHSFSIGADGGTPLSGLAADDAGNLYGTASGGGGTDCYTESCGTLYKIATDGTFKVLFDFDQAKGWAPEAGLTMGADGNFYGTAASGGRSCRPFGCGTVYELKR